MSKFTNHGTITVGGKLVLDGKQVEGIQLNPDEQDLPHSDAEHNPLWCRGNGDGQNSSDDPCWSCIEWAFDKLGELLTAQKA